MGIFLGHQQAETRFEELRSLHENRVPLPKKRGEKLDIDRFLYRRFTSSEDFLPHDQLKISAFRMYGHFPHYLILYFTW